MPKSNQITIGDILILFLTIGIYCFDGDANLNRYLYVIAIIFIGYMIVYLLNKKFLDIHYFITWFPFILICALSCLWTIDASASTSRVSTLLLNYILFGLLFVYVIDFDKCDHLLRDIAVAGGVFSIYIVVYYGGFSSFIALMQSSSGRIGGEVAHLSRIGQSLTLSGVVSANLALKRKTKAETIIFSFIYVLNIIVILASQSRTSLAVVIIGTVITFLTYIRSERVRSWLPRLVVIMIVLFLIYQYVDFSSVLGRWEGIADILSGGSGDASSEERLDLIRIGLDKFTERPLLGWGINSSGSLSSYQAYLHNNFVELLATVGLTGFISFYAVYVKEFIKLRKLDNKDFYTKSALILLVTQLLIMFGTVSYYVKYHYLIIVYFMAISYKYSIMKDDVSTFRKIE
ncbi:MAG: O-antigen ligase family protein [Lachnospiraceae bacterium]|nr:O-antigen ligase family protein [Lachnospiraceae bacterium]